MIIGLLLALVHPAAAIDVKWWGVGPTIGTMAIPATYPVTLPVNAFTGGDRDKDALVDKVKGDVEFGAHAVVFPTASGRLGARALLGFGTNGWNRQEFTIEYEPALVREKDFSLLFGAGIGAGTEQFPSAEANDTAYLRANYFPVRAQLTALLRNKHQAYEIGLFGTWHIVGDQNYYDKVGDTDPTSGSDAANKVIGLSAAGAFYAAVGAEATVYFGDFRGKQASSSGDDEGDGRRTNNRRRNKKNRRND
jgi:hypothetical protein